MTCEKHPKSQTVERPIIDYPGKYQRVCAACEADSRAFLDRVFQPRSMSDFLRGGPIKK